MAKRSDKNIARKKAILAAQAQAEKKAENIVVINVAGLCNFTEYFVIATGLSPHQFKAMADNIQEKLARLGFKPYHIDGLTSERWLVLDYDDVIVHIFSPEARAYYDLERLWGDGEFVDWEAEAKK